MANVFNRKLARNINSAPAGSVSGSISAGTWTVIGLTVANTASTAIQASVYIKVSGTTDYYLVKNADIPLGGSLVVVGGDQKVVLNTTDQLWVSTDGATNYCDVIMSTLEQT